MEESGIKIVCYIGCTMPQGAKPSSNAKVYGCDACEYIQDNEMHRCNKFIAFAGKDPQSEDKFIDQWACSEAWMPTLILENAQMIRSMTTATESFRNESVKQQDILNKLFGAALTGNTSTISFDPVQSDPELIDANVKIITDE